MSKMIKIAVDAMGGDNSPKKILEGIDHHYKSNNNTLNSYIKGVVKH